MAARIFRLQSCDCQFDLHCDNDDVSALVANVFGALASRAVPRPTAHRAYHIKASRDAGYVVSSQGQSVELSGPAALLVHIDKSITIDLQHLRPDLLFVHGAVLARNGRAAIVSAPPGTGKSTFTLAALHLGLEYLSDELAPIDLERLTVYSYPRAMHLKTPPPVPYSLPPGVLTHGSGYHVPVIPAVLPVEPARIAALIFLQRDRHTSEGLQPITPASGATRLIANTLNLLAHPAAGIDAAAKLSRAVTCFELDATNLAAASNAVLTALR